MQVLDSLHIGVRRGLKALFWLVTPWRMPARMRFMREVAVREQEKRALAKLLEEARLQLDALRHGNGGAYFPVLDIYDDESVRQAVGPRLEETFWPPVDGGSVRDSVSAARFLIDTLRHRPDIRARFPAALSVSGANEIVAWLRAPDARMALGISAEGAEHLVALFADDFGARARQLFLASTEIRDVLPHGLMPSGRRHLFRWFMQHGLRSGAISPEEIWWLFLQAAEDPRAELAHAFLFTPDWQRRFPDALTVFGWPRFLEWFGASYGTAHESLSSPGVPPGSVAPAVQVRLGYWAHAEWRRLHPGATSDATAARGFLEWLVSSRGDGAPIDSHARAWCAQLDIESTIQGILSGRVNVIGHFCYPSGLRVSVEAMVEAMSLAGIQPSLRDMRTDPGDDPRHVHFNGLESGDVTIIHVQPEPFFSEVYARADLAPREPRPYRVAYWYWEFDSIPQAWCPHAEQVDEVWAATEFVARGLRERLSVPVRTIFPGVTLPPFEVRSRPYFGLTEGRFAFLFTFHMMSVMERKNPLGLIRAFEMAFRPDEPVTLVLKTSFGDRHPEQFRELCEAASRVPTVTIIDRILSTDEVLSLMHACDAYVSLHRSEGLGLTMAEAMLMGKPVVATAFSGNMDFMDEDNSLLVPYERVKVGRPIPPYDAEMEWAEPSVEHAATLMRRLYDDPKWASEVGERGRRSAEANLSLAAAGQRIAARLEEIEGLRRNGRRPD